MPILRWTLAMPLHRPQIPQTRAPARCFGSVSAFRTTTGQPGYALSFAASGAMMQGFGFASLRERQADGAAWRHRPVAPDDRPSTGPISREALRHELPLRQQELHRPDHCGSR